MSPLANAPKFGFAGALAYLIVYGGVDWFLIFPPIETGELQLGITGALGVVIGGLLSRFNIKIPPVGKPKDGP